MTRTIVGAVVAVAFALASRAGAAPQTSNGMTCPTRQPARTA
jgi:hypothetical protein